MWSGTIAEAEQLTNWAICDGANNTPDLRDKFVLGVGTGSTAAKGEEGGSNSITLSEGQMPAHNHNITDNGHTHGDGTLTAANKSLTGDVQKISECYNVAGTASGVFSKKGTGNSPVTGSSSNSPTAVSYTHLRAHETS